MARKSAHEKTPFSFSRLFSKAFRATLNPELLMLQALTLILSLLAFSVFSFGMLLVVSIVSFVSIVGGFLPFVLFVTLFGIATWVLGMMCINAFMNGVQYHLGMQAVTKKTLDIHLAWKLSSARWRDALLVQGGITAILLGILIVSLLPLFFSTNSPDVLFTITHPSLLLSRAPITLFVLVLLFFWVQPFLIMAPPIVYFENAKPAEVAQRVKKYVKPHYIQILAAFIMLVIISTILSTLGKWATKSLFVSTPNEMALTFVVFAGIAFLVNILVLLVCFALSICTQTLLYLHVGNPQPMNTFVTKGAFSQALSSMAPSHARHSPYLPVKWKRPGKR